ncbi:peptidoglycan editing factor PgeF [Thermaerobacter subterraneus]|uniref:Purine nucleoside phosphorylase n=1 Tax=Thermaerobacter subterraneus DSM 13965 TaxID=867903 RepID=K6Q433_9FIRM|nr:peptidoglycan editing factor PgeF [Thermaerobacter subterraneus]EKP95889.1 uncharacterized protein, YfiH family [Thermaerobacter subterraneus DSM 13965]
MAPEGAVPEAGRQTGAVMRRQRVGGVEWLVPSGAPPWLFLAFTTRRGGVSRGPWAELNLGRSTADEPARVEANRQRVLAAAGPEWQWVAMPRMVHGAAVAVARAGEPWAPGRGPEADALVTTDPGVLLWATFADCVPVFLWGSATASRRGVALAHAGWRGTLAGVAPAAARALAEALGTGPERLHALIGPSIGPCCFEVDEPVLESLGRRLPWAEEVLSPSPRGAGYRHWDLWETNRRLLVEAGLDPRHVAVAGLCTACDTETFFSHRASGGRTGRMAGLIGIRPGAPAS